MPARDRSPRSATPGGRRALGLLLLAALLAGTASVRSASAAETADTRYRDRNWKFSFLKPKDWAPIPVETAGKGQASDPLALYTVAKFAQPDAGRQGAEIMAFRMGDGLVTTDPALPDLPPGVKLPPGFKLPKPVKTMEGLLDHLCERLGSPGAVNSAVRKDIVSKDKVAGRLWTFELAERGMFCAFAAWKKGDVEQALWFDAGTAQRKKMEPLFAQMAKSFVWFDAQADEAASLPQLDGINITPKRRRDIEKGLVTGWDVTVSPKKQYVIIYNTKNRTNVQLAKELAERIEAIRAQVYEVQFPPAAPIEAVSIVRVCANAAEYHEYGGPGGSAGYWNDDTEELVFYDASEARKTDKDTLAVLYHEAFHQFIYYSVGEVAPHSWFNEGHGDYYAGARYAGRKFTIRPFDWRVGVIKNALTRGPRTVTVATPSEGDARSRGRDDGSPHYVEDLKSGGYTPLQYLVRMSQMEYYTDPGTHYAQGWSLVYFLREIVPENPKWNAKWGKILETYFRTLKEEVNKDTPLARPKPKPDAGPDAPPAPGVKPTTPDEPTAPGGAPGMADPAMGDPAMGDPAMGDPGMSDPGMSDPGMGDPGMGEKGAPEGPPPSDATGSDSGIPLRMARYMNSARALQRAVDEAFKGVDFAELEAAWKASISKVGSK